LCRHLAAGTRYETLDHTGDKLIVRPGVETVVEVIRRPVAGEASATVRVRVPSDRLSDLRTAVAAASEQAQQRYAAGARQDGAPDDVVTELTEPEFHDAAGKALARLGLTYAELEDQARRRDFSSAQARS